MEDFKVIKRVSIKDLEECITYTVETHPDSDAWLTLENDTDGSDMTITVEAAVHLAKAILEVFGK